MIWNENNFTFASGSTIKHGSVSMVLAKRANDSHEEWVYTHIRHYQEVVWHSMPVLSSSFLPSSEATFDAICLVVSEGIEPYSFGPVLLIAFPLFHHFKTIEHIRLSSPHRIKGLEARTLFQISFLIHCRHLHPSPANTSDSVHLIVSDVLEAYLPLKGMVDVAKEIERVRKQMKKVQSDLDGFNKRLGAKNVSYNLRLITMILRIVLNEHPTCDSLSHRFCSLFLGSRVFRTSRPLLYWYKFIFIVLPYQLILPHPIRRVKLLNKPDPTCSSRFNSLLTRHRSRWSTELKRMQPRQKRSFHCSMRVLSNCKRWLVLCLTSLLLLIVECSSITIYTFKQEMSQPASPNQISIGESPLFISAMRGCLHSYVKSRIFNKVWKKHIVTLDIKFHVYADAPRKDPWSYIKQNNWFEGMKQHTFSAAYKLRHTFHVMLHNLGNVFALDTQTQSQGHRTAEHLCI